MNNLDGIPGAKIFVRLFLMWNEAFWESVKKNKTLFI